MTSKLLNDFENRMNEIVGKTVKYALVQGNVDFENAKTFADIQHYVNYVSDVSVFKRESNQYEIGQCVFHFVQGDLVQSCVLFTDDEKQELIYVCASGLGLPLTPNGGDVACGIYMIDLRN
ncbi:hypothetical protein [Wielerella bovis]|uniref:hypothetical protein n=1 Tax=Wielerella bovis TaxID=2917790 RepID=UPI0020192B5B|nr:hypothetical protein [Wielerella bovis]ULJ66647.1 hypothetical protein MIS31_10420 [Wielerella bovis]